MWNNLQSLQHIFTNYGAQTVMLSSSCANIFKRVAKSKNTIFSAKHAEVIFNTLNTYKLKRNPWPFTCIYTVVYVSEDM